LPAATLAEVEGLPAGGQVIDAIKLVREATGSGLKDAKDAVDEMRRSVLQPR
jgi:ribosomal protein L7/L12